MPRASQRLGGKKKREMRRRLGCTRRQWRRSILSFRPERKAFVVVAFQPIWKLFQPFPRSRSLKTIIAFPTAKLHQTAGGAGKRGQGRQQQCASVKHLNVGRSIFHSSGEKRSDGRKLIESFSLDGGAAEIFFFPFPLFSKIFSDFPPRIESHPLSRVCAGSATRKDVYSTEVQRLGSISRPNEISFTHTRSRRQIYPWRAQRHTHTHKRK